MPNVLISEKKGYTLIELLVVIAIIAILSSIGLVIFTNVMKQGRDSRRQSDLRAIQSALEQYFADQMYYPVFESGAICPATNGKLKSGCALKNSDGTRTYINTIPTDPVNTSPNIYIYDPSPSGCDNSTPALQCTSYCVYAEFERTGLGQPATCTNPSYDSYDSAVTIP